MRKIKFCKPVPEPISINENSLCVLIQSPNTNFVAVEYIPITRTIDYQFSVITDKIFNSNLSARAIVAYIINDPILKVLFSPFNYCKELSKPFQGMLSTIEAIQEKYHSNYSPKYSDYVQRISQEKQDLLIECQSRLQAYYLQLAYPQVIANKNIKAYSHVLVGWKCQPFIVNHNFSVEFITNFGYGQASYFYTKIKYKGLYIVPYTDWIIYEEGRIMEIISYSSKHKLYNERWKDAMEYVRDACNLALADEKAFVQNYVIQECEKLVDGLENILNKNEFKFVNNRIVNGAVNKTGYELIEFRGIKISGALEFIKTIIPFDKITPMSQYIQRIEEFNKILKPVLIKELLKINELLPKLHKQQIKLNNSLALMHDINKNFIADRLYVYAEKKVPFGFSKRSFKNKEEFEEWYNKKNPSYAQFMVDFSSLKIQIAELFAQVRSLENTKFKVNQYIIDIDKYFQSQHRF